MGRSINANDDRTNIIPASRPAAITLAIARAIAFFIVLVLLKNVHITSGLTTDRFIQRYYNNKL